MKSVSAFHQVSRCSADTSAPTLNNRPDVDVFIFNLMIPDCFCKDKKMKISTLPLLIWGSQKKNMDCYILVVLFLHWHRVYSLRYCLYRTKISSVKFDLHEFWERAYVPTLSWLDSESLLIIFLGLQPIYWIFPPSSLGLGGCGWSPSVIHMTPCDWWAIKMSARCT